MRQLNRNAIFGPNIFGSTISYSIVSNDNTLDTRNDLWLQMCFFAKNIPSDWQNMKLLAKDCKIWQIGSDEKNNWLANLIKAPSK